MNYLAGIKLGELPQQDSYLCDLPVIQYLQSVEQLKFTMPVTFFVGENGTGKSTLLEAIAVAMGFNPEGGSRDFMFSTKASHSALYQSITTVKTGLPKDGFFLRAESFYNATSYLENLEVADNFDRYGGVSFHKQSHGESFLSLVMNRFEGNGIYILDEPEAALSPQRVMSLMVAMDELVRNNSQLLIATHSPILTAYPHAEILQLTASGIQSVSYKECEPYQITKQFLDRPEQMMRHLLNPEI